MLKEQIKNILAAVANDFILRASTKWEIYLYGEDVLADNLAPLSADRAIKVTFEYCDAPKSD